jgi:hypothetical protein
MKKSRFLVSFRSSTSELSKEGNIYHKVSLQSFAEKVDDKWIANDTLDFLRVSNLTFEMWFKGKTSPSNILILDVEYRVAGVTEYLVDDVVKQHSTTGIECTSCVQATLYDIIDVAESVNIEKYKSTMFNAIKMANIVANRF